MATKGYHVHALGASGGWKRHGLMVMQERRVPHVANLRTDDPECDLSLVRTQRPLHARTVLANTTGFGGINAALVFREVEEEASGGPGGVQQTAPIPMSPPMREPSRPESRRCVAWTCARHQGGDEPVNALDGVSLGDRRRRDGGAHGAQRLREEYAAQPYRVRGSSRPAVWRSGVSTGALGDDALTRFRPGRVGTVFQFFNLLPSLSAGDNVASRWCCRACANPMWTAGSPKRSKRSGSGQVAGLPLRAFRRPDAAGGDRARNYSDRPAILLADDKPTGNLDSHTGEVVWICWCG